MKIPRRLKIGTVTYKVVRVKNPKNMASINYDTLTISINKTFNKSFEAGSFMHELLEGICTQNCLRITHQELSVLAEQLTTVLTENKMLK